MSATLPIFLKLIRFEHTLFALPYAIAGAVIAAGGLPDARTCLWVLVAMVGARTAAMAFNRLVDRRFDATNPRTQGRASVTGAVGPGFLLAATASSAAVFLGAAWMLDKPGKPPWALWLAPPTLAVLLGYSLTKRFSSSAHFVLGLALGLSPLGAWVAVRGDLGAEALPCVALGAAVLLWTAGFDIVYALQDLEHDRSEGLHSIPARLGPRGALAVARLAHLGVPVALYLAGRWAGLGLVYQGAVVLVGLLLVLEHLLVAGGRLERLQQAFFHVNVAIAIIVMTATLIDILVIGKDPS